MWHEHSVYGLICRILITSTYSLLLRCVFYAHFPVLHWVVLCPHGSCANCNIVYLCSSLAERRTPSPRGGRALGCRERRRQEQEGSVEAPQQRRVHTKSVVRCLRHSFSSPPRRFPSQQPPGPFALPLLPLVSQSRRFSAHLPLSYPVHSFS